MTVQTLMKIVWTVFEKFETFIETWGEKTSRLHKFFATPKNYLCLPQPYTLISYIIENEIHTRYP